MPKQIMPALFVLLWATGFIGAKYAMPHAEPFWFLAVRFTIAGIVLAGFATATRRRWPSGKNAANAVIAGALVHGAYLACVFWAIRNGLPAGMSALIVGLQPILTTLFAAILLGERSGSRHWLALLSGLAGVLFVLWPKLALASPGINCTTILASFSAVLAISAGTVWQKKTGKASDLVTGTALQYAGATLLTLLLSLMFETQQFDPVPVLWFAMAWLVIVLSIGAIFLLMQLIRDGSMNRVGALFYLVPAVTALMAWLLFDETLTPMQLAGMAVVAVSVWVATAQPREMRLRDSA
ncbi:MAG: DMT family transporter [Rhizobiaceae bacterium]